MTEADASSHKSHRSWACAAMPGSKETTVTEADASSHESETSVTEANYLHGA